MRELKKFVRTPHIRGSRIQHGDHDLEAVPFEELRGKHLVVEEKVDGSNFGVSFDDDGTLLLQSRGHYLRGGPRERQFEPLKQWAAARQTELFDALGTRYVMYGESLYAKHTMWYDALPHYLMEFDVLDTETGQFLDTPSRGLLLNHSFRAWSTVCPVLVLAEGTFDRIDQLRALITRSNFVTDDRIASFNNAAEAAGVVAAQAWAHTDHSDLMEGLYVKWEEDGVVKGRYKFVRDSFTNAVLDQEQHWHDRPIVPNQLAPGAYERMFT